MVFNIKLKYTTVRHNLGGPKAINTALLAIVIAAQVPNINALALF
jgi:hypothetical protein